MNNQNSEIQFPIPKTTNKVKTTQALRAYYDTWGFAWKGTSEYLRKIGDDMDDCAMMLIVMRENQIHEGEQKEI